MVKLAERISKQNSQAGLTGMLSQFHRSLNTLTVCFDRCLTEMNHPATGSRSPLPTRSRFTLSNRLARG